MSEIITDLFSVPTHFVAISTRYNDHRPRSVFSSTNSFGVMIFNEECRRPLLLPFAYNALSYFRVSVIPLSLLVNFDYVQFRSRRVGLSAC